MLRTIYRNSILAILLVVVGLKAHAQLVSFPGVASTFAGDTSGQCPDSPATYTGPVASNYPACGLVLHEPTAVTTDAQGNVYIADLSGSNATAVVRVVASGNGPIPVLSNPSQSNYVANPIAGTVYPIAGQGDTGCTTSTDTEGDGCLAPQSTLASGTDTLAVDSSGNVYIVDRGDYLIRVLYAGGNIMPPGLGNQNPQAGFIYSIAGTGEEEGTGTATGPAMSAAINPTLGVAVDSNGNVYFPESSETVSYISVLYSSGSVPGLPTSPSPVSGNLYAITNNDFDTLRGVALDANGNIYVGNGDEIGAVYAAGSLPGISNPTVGTVYEIAGDGSTSAVQNGKLALQTPIGTPYGIAFDALGNVYIANEGGSTNAKPKPGYVYQLAPDDYVTTPFGTASPGCAAQTDTIGDGCLGIQASLSEPYSVAVTPSGNVLIADYKTNLIRELNTAATSLTFETQAVETDSAVQTVTLENSGAANLDISNIVASSQFAVESNLGATDCQAGVPIAPGGTCEIEVAFEPTEAGSPTGTVTIESNALNATNGANIINLAGTTLFTTSTTVTATPTSPGAYQNVTLTATVSSVGGVTPTGTVTFAVGSTTLGTASLTGGTGSITTQLLPYGTDTVLATYSGDTNNQASLANFPITITYGAELTVSPNPIAIQQGQTETATLTVTPVGSILSSGVSLTCLPSAPGLTCSLGTSWVNLPANGVSTTPVQVPITLTASAAGIAQNANSRGKSNPFNLALLLPGVFGLLAVSQRRRLRMSQTVQGLILVFVALNGAICLTSCSSGPSSSTTSSTPVQQTVTINAIFANSGTSAPILETTSFQVTVQ